MDEERMVGMESILALQCTRHGIRKRTINSSVQIIGLDAMIAM